MVEIVILGISALFMSEIYSRTRRPKLYAFLNTAAGAGALLLSQLAVNGEICINNYSCALSGILGVPGAVLVMLLGIGG